MEITFWIGPQHLRFDAGSTLAFVFPSGSRKILNEHQCSWYVIVASLNSVKRRCSAFQIIYRNSACSEHVPWWHTCRYFSGLACPYISVVEVPSRALPVCMWFAVRKPSTLRSSFTSIPRVATVGTRKVLTKCWIEIASISIHRLLRRAYLYWFNLIVHCECGFAFQEIPTSVCSSVGITQP